MDKLLTINCLGLATSGMDFTIEFESHKAILKFDDIELKHLVEAILSDGTSWINLKQFRKLEVYSDVKQNKVIIIWNTFPGEPEASFRFSEFIQLFDADMVHQTAIAIKESKSLNRTVPPPVR